MTATRLPGRQGLRVPAEHQAVTAGNELLDCKYSLPYAICNKSRASTCSSEKCRWQPLGCPVAKGLGCQLSTRPWRLAMSVRASLASMKSSAARSAGWCPSTISNCAMPVSARTMRVRYEQAVLAIGCVSRLHLFECRLGQYQVI